MGLRVALSVLAAVGLVGCTEVANGFGNLGGSNDATSRGIRTLSLLGGDVRVRGPEGYCIDQSASNARRGFVVMVGCAVLSDDIAVMPSLDGLIVVQIGTAGSASVTGNEDAFAAFIESEAGRGLLARDGNVRNVAEVTTVTDRAGVMVRFQDATGPTFAGTSGPQWRGFLDVQSRLVTLSILSFDRGALSRSEGQRLLVVAMAEIAEVNVDATPAE